MDRTTYLPDGTLFDFWEKEAVYDRQLHVDRKHPLANDWNDGSAEHPFLTIQEAARRAVPGTRVLIHEGEYREWVRPMKGGVDAFRMISYEAFEGERVVVKASEEVTDFSESKGWRLRRSPSDDGDYESCRIWKYRLDPALFCGYNPFCCVNILHDRLFVEYDKTDMTPYLNRRGMIFCDGRPLCQVALYSQMAVQAGSYWVEANGQTVHFRLENDEDPKKHRIEVTCREQCFAPEIPFLSYIRVKGITFAHAAGGAPVPQRGALSCYRGHHWIIEDCEIDWSNGVGIDVGNECWHYEIEEDQIIGCSVIRGCTVKDAGVCGIAGLFARQMLIEDNLIEGTGWQRMELSWEAGGIKLHNSVNGLIRRNVFRNTLRADHLWLDCGNVNNRITHNLFLDGMQQREAVFIECTRDGVNLIDNNLIWNVEGRFDETKIPVEPGSSGWYKTKEHDVINGYGIYGEGTDHLRIAGNLIGNCRSAGYFAKPVSFRMGGLDRGGTSRDARILGNLFYNCKEAALKLPTKDNQAEGNLYVKQLGGYLRILYPEPEICLHLPAWQEFYGFDRIGQEGWFDIEVDTKALTLRFLPAKGKIPGLAADIKRRNFVYHADELAKPDKVRLAMIAGVDGSALWDEEKAFEEGQVYVIDPRKRGARNESMELK